MLNRLLILTALAASGCASGGGAQRLAEVGPPDGNRVLDSGPVADSMIVRRDAQVTGPDFEDRGTRLAGATSATCIVDNPGTVRCWGSNSRGQLGRGATEPTEDFNPAAAMGLSEVLSVAGSSTRFCALTARDEVFCWGHASRYASGVLSEEGLIATPTKLDSLPAISRIDVGQVHSCALEIDGGVWCWGGNYAGQVGTGSTSIEEPPTRVQGLENIKDIAVGSAVSCALSNDGTVRCWGASASGIVPTESDSVTPVVIDGLGVVAAIRMGANNACALEESGALKCWGRNRDLQLGAAVAMDAVVNQPLTIELPEVPIDVQVGRATICALGQSGTLYCWGDGADGEIGDGAAVDRDTPTLVADLPEVIYFGSYYNHTCALTAEDLYCWGANSRGQLGTEEGEDILSPQKVEL